jgi:hypothetical protein
LLALDALVGYVDIVQIGNSPLRPTMTLGALIAELERLKLFVVEIRDFDALLVPAESASAAPEAAKPVTVSGKVSADLAAQFRTAASQAGTNVSALIAQFVADYVAAHA